MANDLTLNKKLIHESIVTLKQGSGGVGKYFFNRCNMLVRLTELEKHPLVTTNVITDSARIVSGARIPT